MAMHRLATGDSVHVSLPRSAFAPAATARHFLLVAAGIGITPVLSHARACAEWGVAADLIYVYRPGAGAHAAEVKELLGDDLTECNNRDSFQKVLDEKLKTQPLGTHLYVCGPTAFIDSVLDQAREHGWPPVRLHSAAFGGWRLLIGNTRKSRESHSQYVPQRHLRRMLALSASRYTPAPRSLPERSGKGREHHYDVLRFPQP